MQFQVPQFVEVEDKIVGPFTLRQFLYVAAAAGLSFFLFFTVQSWLWFVLSVILVGSALGLAFVKINGQSLTRMALAAVHFYWQPQTYVWQPENPQLPKTESALRGLAGPGFSLESIVSGLALKTVWQNLQTGSRRLSAERGRWVSQKERYEILHRLSGERRAVRRVDYR